MSGGVTGLNQLDADRTRGPSQLPITSGERQAATQTEDEIRRIVGRQSRRSRHNDQIQNVWFARIDLDG